MREQYCGGRELHDSRHFFSAGGGSSICFDYSHRQCGQLASNGGSDRNGNLPATKSRWKSRRDSCHSQLRRGQGTGLRSLAALKRDEVVTQQEGSPETESG